MSVARPVTNDQIHAATLLYMAGWAFAEIAGVMAVDADELGRRVRPYFAAVRTLRPVNRRRPLSPTAEAAEARRLREIRA